MVKKFCCSNEGKSVNFLIKLIGGLPRILFGIYGPGHLVGTVPNAHYLAAYAVLKEEDVRVHGSTARVEGLLYIPFLHH